LQCSCCVTDYLFSPLSKESGVPALWLGHWDSPAVTEGSAGSLCTVGGRPLSTCTIVTPWRNWDSSSWTGETGLSCREAGALQLSGSGELCTSVHHGRQAFWCYSLSSSLQLSSPQWGIWHFWSLMEKWGLSCGWAQWEAWGLFVP
jgi:hypothetical protein